MKTNPVKGMRDILPYEQRLRDSIQSKILEVYQNSGFERISTPILEDIENLNKSDGGENLNLIFKVLKRGEKLDQALKTGNSELLSDIGLRYDLTLPLSRYYAANREALPVPFKVIQTDRVYRAERPQKGRFREFVQCDIDILGDSSANAEVELIDVTARALLAIGFSDFCVNVNDRRVLRSMLESMGFTPDSLDSVCITFDKLDKIGLDGVKSELTEKSFPDSAIQKLTEFLSKADFSLETVISYLNDSEIARDLQYVLKTAQKLSANKYSVLYNPSLVRGQGYYTGIVFEVNCPQFSGAIAGGGRYDGMIGKFIGQQIPAVGFSIGFERICAILLEKNTQITGQKEKYALLYNADSDFCEVLQKAENLRTAYNVSVIKKHKKVGQQLNQLEKAGFTHFAQLENGELRTFGNKQV